MKNDEEIRENQQRHTNRLMDYFFLLFDSFHIKLEGNQVNHFRWN